MKVLTVYYHGKKDEPLNLGSLAFYKGRAQFEYSKEALASNLQLSPYNLKLAKGLIQADCDPFRGLHGLFNDSLPDGWGLYVMDKAFKKHGIELATINPLDRLAFIGDRAMGALSYHPDEGMKYLDGAQGEIDIDALAEESVQTYEGELEGELEGVVDELADVGSPSGGARPKALLGINDGHAIAGTLDLPGNYSHWLIKFPTGKTPDKRSEGSIEYLYSEMARKAGVDFPETRLVSGEGDNHYFMVKRFDRSQENHRHHMHTLAGILNLDFRINMAGYSDLLKVCGQLTRSHKETSQLFRRMLFNIMSGNRDDHSKNFSFMMSDKGEWVNSPAYDVVYNPGINGEHTMDINAKGKNFVLDDINRIGKEFSISKKDTSTMIQEISESLSSWNVEAHHYSIPKEQVLDISRHINSQRKLLTPRPPASENTLLKS